MLHNCYNLLCDRPIHTKDCRIIAIKIKIRRTKLCVLISIAVPSYLMLSANILTSVVNNSLSTFPADWLPEICAPGICPGHFCLFLKWYIHPLARLRPSIWDPDHHNVRPVLPPRKNPDPHTTASVYHPPMSDTRAQTPLEYTSFSGFQKTTLHCMHSQNFLPFLNPRQH